MKSNNDDARLLPDQRPFHVLIVPGASRRQYNCPGVDPKLRALMLRMAERFAQEREIDYEYLSDVYAREKFKAATRASRLR